MKKLIGVIMLFMLLFNICGCKVNITELTVNFYSDNIVIDTQKIKKNEKLNEPAAPSKEGYEFIGWLSDSKLVEFPIVVTKNLELNAKWGVDIKFMYRGNILQQSIIPEGEMPVFNGEIPIKENDEFSSYVYTGWTPTLTSALKSTIYSPTFMATPLKITYKDSAIKSINNFDGSDDFVLWTGRNYANSGNYFLNNTASGFEVSFNGTSLTAEVVSNSYNGALNPQMCVLVDGEKDCEKNIITLPFELTSQRISIVSGLKQGYHTVKVFKITEAHTSSIGIKSISVDGNFTTRITPMPKRMQIEVYGDSISTGCNNQKAKGEADNKNNLSNKTQNGMQTYATFAAQDLNADISIFAKTGIGIYNTYGNMNLSMLKYYNKTYCGLKNYINDSSINPIYDFSNKADLVIINLGTNDIWSGESNERIIEKHKELVKKIIEKNNDVKIIVCAGAMTDSLNYGLQSFVKELSKTNNNIFYQKLNPSLKGHPSKEEHRLYADTLVKKIIKIMNLA